MKQKIKTPENINLEDLTGKLKKKDQHYARLTKRIQIFYWVLLPVYLFMSILQIWDDGNYIKAIGSLCYMSALLIFALFFRNYYKIYNFVDYSLPTLVMLKNAVRRYQPFKINFFWILIGTFLADLGLVLEDWPNTDILETQISFWGAICISILIGLTIWWFRYKPLRDEALFLIREIEQEDEI